MQPSPGDDPMTTKTTTPAKAQPAAPEALILDFATKHFFIEKLETRNRERLDFHDVAVWAMRAALTEAYPAGVAAATKR